MDVVGRRRLGRVVVAVPLDDRLLARLGQAADLDEGESLAFARGRRFTDGPIRSAPAPDDLRRPKTIDAGGTTYRGAAVPLGRDKTSPRLVVLLSAAAIASDAAAARWRVALVGLVALAAVVIVAYALAPGIARSRVLRHQRDQAVRVLSHVGDGIFLIDRDGLVRFWNQAAEAITGLPAEVVRDRPAAETIRSWPAIAPLVPVTTRPGAAGEGARPETFPVDVDGRELWLSIAGVEFSEGTVYAFRDVTGDQRLEEMRTEIVATVSHELRTPLASLHGAAMTLQRHRDALRPDTEQELLDVIADQSKRLADLVEEILVAGQLASGSLRVVREVFDPEPVVRTAVAGAGLGAPVRISVVVVAPETMPQVVGDADRTRQVLLNLIDNAIKYAPEGGRIEVRLERVRNSVRFSVRDEGAGIPPAEQERIFEKFYRLDPHQRQGVGGTGLGLYISRELVRSMGGRIWVDSAPGAGATFAFELPVAELEDPLRAATISRPFPGSSIGRASGC